MAEFSKEILIQYRHLHFPIRNGAEKIRMQICLDAQVVREFEAELALDGPRQWWSFYDVSAFQGKVISLQSIGADLSESQAELLGQLITQSDGLLYTQDLYAERYRPQFRFTPRRGWNNDPNGLFFLDDTWHMFYQWNPFGIGWGNMHWGHATSRDLIHWQEQPTALFQKSLQDMPWSGGAVVDARNTSGFGIAAEEPLVLSFTSTGRGECLAYSLDGGRSFQEYNGNPVIAHAGRDPKIIWFESMHKWVMIVYDENGSEQRYALYDSTDLKKWRWMQFLPGWFECPELFDLAVDGGDPGERCWVVYGCIQEKLPSAFLLGAFDGKTFAPHGAVQPAHGGPHFYAAQIFSHAPQGRRIMLGWLRDATYPGMPFGNGMSVPLELSLRRVSGETRLCFYPVKEFDELRIATKSGENITVDQANKILEKSNDDLMDIDILLTPLNRNPFILDIRGHPILFNPSAKQVTFAGKTLPCQPDSGKLHLRVLVDRSVTEVFADHGWGAFASMTIFTDLRPIHLGGDVSIDRLTIHQLKSIWR